MSNDHKLELKIVFSNQAALTHFAKWLDGSGEQNYWDWMEYREEEEEGDITAIRFNYFDIKNKDLPVSDPERYGEYLKDNTIHTVCGRKSKR